MAPNESRGGRRLKGRTVAILAALVLATSSGLSLVADVDVAATPKGLRVDGRPFFPVGIYWAPTSKFARLRDMGFNVVHLWGSNEEATRRELDEAHRLGMRAVIELSEMVRGNKPLSTTLLPFVEALRTHPAVLTWYLVDEPGSEALSRIEQGYKILRAADPAHPVLIVHFAANRVATIAPFLDILGVDGYPVPNQPLSVFWSQLHRNWMVAGIHKPAWTVVQAFNKPVDGKPTRYPTPVEVRNMVYQSMIAGATGLLYFSYAWQGILEEQDPGLFAALGPINREVTTLAPMLLEGVRVESGIRVHAHGDLRSSIREWSGQTYVTVVNIGTTPTRVEVHRRSGGGGRVESVFEDRSWPMRNGSFTDNLEAYGVRVYRF